MVGPLDPNFYNQVYSKDEEKRLLAPNKAFQVPMPNKSDSVHKDGKKKKNKNGQDDDDEEDEDKKPLPRPMGL